MQRLPSRGTDAFPSDPVALVELAPFLFHSCVLHGTQTLSRSGKLDQPENYLITKQLFTYLIILLINYKS
jgi:hypothetical protein